MERTPATKSKKAREMSFRKQLDDYLREGTLHGLRYIGDRTITWFERFVSHCFRIQGNHRFITQFPLRRVFFACVLLVVLVLSGWLITIIWIKWTTATIITFSPYRTPVSDLPFPAITICNTNIIQKTAVQTISPNSEEHKMAEDICSIEYGFPLTATTWTRFHQVWHNVNIISFHIAFHILTSAERIQGHIFHLSAVGTIMR